MKNLTFYLAGKIEDESTPICNEKFNALKKSFQKHGLKAISTFDLGLPISLPFNELSTFCFKALRSCNAIVMMEDYKESLQALALLDYAKQIRIDVFFYSDKIFQEIEDEYKLSIISGHA